MLEKKFAAVITTAKTNFINNLFLICTYEERRTTSHFLLLKDS